jgi:hypothetical protein
MEGMDNELLPRPDCDPEPLDAAINAERVGGLEIGGSRSLQQDSRQVPSS